MMPEPGRLELFWKHSRATELTAAHSSDAGVIAPGQAGMPPATRVATVVVTERPSEAASDAEN